MNHQKKHLLCESGWLDFCIDVFWQTLQSRTPDQESIAGKPIFYFILIHLYKSSPPFHVKMLFVKNGYFEFKPLVISKFAAQKLDYLLCNTSQRYFFLVENIYFRVKSSQAFGYDFVIKEFFKKQLATCVALGRHGNLALGYHMNLSGCQIWVLRHAFMSLWRNIIWHNFRLLENFVTDDKKQVVYVNQTRKRQWLSRGEPGILTPERELHQKRIMLSV